MLEKAVDTSSQAQGYKTFFMLNSTEHKILNVFKYKNIKKFSILHIYNICWHFNISEQKRVVLSWVEHEKVL